jgi:two-component system response regulator RegA
MKEQPPILLVDDDVAFVERLAKAFEARGFSAVAKGSCKEARASLDQNEFSGAVIDLRLGDGSGLELVSKIQERCPDIPIVVLTGFGSIATALEAVRIGARDYLTKPADPDQILTALRMTSEAGSAGLEVPFQTPSLDRVEWEYIQWVLKECEGNISKASRLLGINRRSLQRKLAKYPPTR